EGISRDALPGHAGTAFPAPADPHLLQGEGLFRGGERVRKGRGYSHGLQGLAEPRFQRLEVFYDHFNHHPERPGPPASPPAATAAAAAPAAGSAPPRRPAARLPPRLPAASAAPRFGRGRRAGAGGPAIRRGRNQSSSGCFPRALLSPLLYGGRRPKRCAGPPRRRAARPSVAAARSGTGGPPAALSRSARRSERPNERLHNEDDLPESSAAEQPSTQPSTSAETPQPPQTAALPEADTSPPPYCSIAVEAATTSDTHNEFYPVPPPYSVATSLPTYDEAEKAKAAAMAAAAAEVAQRHAQFRESRSLFDEIFLSRPEEEEYPPRDDFSDADQLRVGNDGIFMLAFFMAFIFNWIGFCLSFCITNTIAGRYGAICGFGLSLIKWILIVRDSFCSFGALLIILKSEICLKAWQLLTEQDFFSCTEDCIEQTFLSYAGVKLPDDL
uniref:Nedd4 family interacting protein 2 n=1 Tax=Catharus ustulatus TaxID=91951 RepID=A0A8C3UU91_CATUS